jgi:hypothetical protein
VRRAVYAAQVADNPRRRRRIPLYACLWPLKSVAKSWQATRVWSKFARRLGAPPRWRQLSQLWWLAVRYNLSFSAYYGFRLWRDYAYAQAADFMEDFEAIWFGELSLREQDVGLIDDKLRFAAFCREHDLPTVPLVASVSANGELSWHDGETGLPESDLFVKSGELWSGKGTERWQWDADTCAWCRGRERLDRDGLLARLREAARRDGTLVVQRRVHNHPDVADLSPEAVSTLRCVTWRCNGQPAAVFRSLWRLPRAGMITDHASTGGLSVAVGEGGRLRRPRSRLLDDPDDDHPDFGARITDRILPAHKELLELACRAHDATRLDGLLSWDVALLESGPSLMEGNSVGSVESVQVGFDEPLGATEFVAIADQLLGSSFEDSSSSS